MATSDPPKIDRAIYLQKEFQEWSAIVFPFTTVDVFVTALTFELARLIAQDMDRDVDVDKTIKAIGATLRQRVAAYKAGQVRS